MKGLLLVSAALFALPALAADPAPPKAEALAPTAWLIPGAFPDGRQPDGNTVIFQGATGLVVMDTGRHTWHTQAILDFARARKLPVTAIINSHWHLDHTSGNRRIKQLYPQALLHTSPAVDRIIRDVWPTSVPRSQAFLDSGKAPPGLADDIRGDIETRQHPEALTPDRPVTKSETRTIDGVAFDVRLAANAATDGDVWIYEPASRIAATGDLVTLPVPFLDTACVKGWRNALGEIAATPFTTLVPGHGAPMDRARFLQYKAAFDSYADCASGTTDKAVCAADWAKASAPLRAPEPADDARTLEMAGEYVDLLRSNNGNARLCAAP